MPEIHQCTCAICQGQAVEGSLSDAPEKQIHHQINLLLSRLDEQQRRWYAALEAKRHGHGGVALVSQITGLDEKTILRGRHELEAELAERPQGRVRLPGAGRPPAGKKGSSRPHLAR